MGRFPKEAPLICTPQTEQAHMEYQKFSAEDFIQDELFIEWVTTPSPAAEQFWKSWMAAHPQKLHEITEAKAFIKKLNEGAKASPLSWQRSQNLWAGIHSQIGEHEKSQPLPPVRKMGSPVFRKLGIAASVLLLASLAALLWFNIKPSATRYHTAFGEIKEITLPDSSRVYLNANSTLLVNGNWDIHSEREVQLKGEAYFIVTKQPAPTGQRKFVVHTQDFDVVVIGTRFNVINRENRKRVVLEEGKIDLQLKTENEPSFLQPNAPKQERIQVQAGERVELATKPKEKPLLIEKVNTKVYSSWKTRQLVFDNTPLTELINIIEDNYGYQVIVQDPALLDRKLSGTVPSNNLGTLLKSLELIFKIEISRKGGRQLVFSGTEASG